MGISHEQETLLRRLYDVAIADPAKRAVLEAGRLHPTPPLTGEDLAEVDRRLAALLER